MSDNGNWNDVGRPEGQPWQQQQQPWQQQPQQPGWQQPYVVHVPRQMPEPPLWLPWYGAAFIGSIRRFWKKYVWFDGRASRSEFWWAYLGLYLMTLIVEIPYMIGFFQWEFGYLFSHIDSPGLSSAADRDPFWIYRDAFEHANPTLVVGLVLLVVWWLGTLLPLLGAMARRLHDANRSGWWILIGLVPWAGIIVLVVFWCSGSDPRGQRFDRPRSQPEAAAGR